MAKNKKDLMKENLSTRKPKPADEEIKKAAKDVQEETPEDEGEKGFHIKFPMSHYNKLNQVSKKTHIPKKYIIMQALQEYYENHNH